MKRILILILLFNTFGSSFTQSIYFGGGITISKLDWEEYDLSIEPYNIYEDHSIGYSSGIGLKYLNRKYFNLNTYIGVVRKGAEQFVKYETFPGPQVNKTYSASLVYLDFINSVDVKYKFQNIVEPFFRAGVRIDYLIKSSYQFKAIKERDELSSFNYGFNLGIGCNVFFNKLFIGIFWNKYLNLNKIAEYPPAWGIMGGSINDHTMIFGVEVGYNIK